jgi:hypothetical protein
MSFAPGRGMWTFSCNGRTVTPRYQGTAVCSEKKLGRSGVEKVGRVKAFAKRMFRLERPLLPFVGAGFITARGSEADSPGTGLGVMGLLRQEGIHPSPTVEIKCNPAETSRKFRPVYGAAGRYRNSERRPGSNHPFRDRRSRAASERKNSRRESLFSLA